MPQMGFKHGQLWETARSQCISIKGSGHIHLDHMGIRAGPFSADNVSPSIVPQRTWIFSLSLKQKHSVGKQEIRSSPPFINLFLKYLANLRIIFIYIFRIINLIHFRWRKRFYLNLLGTEHLNLKLFILDFTRGAKIWNINTKILRTKIGQS